MGRKTRRWGCVIGVCALAGSLLAGCGGKESANPAASPAAQSGVKLNKDAKLRIFTPINGAVKGLEAGATTNDNQFVNAIREKTGYKNLEWVTYDPTSQDKLSVLFASGEQIDLLNIANLDYYKYFNTQDVFRTIDDELSKVGGDLAKLVPQAAWEGVKKEGKTVAVPIPDYQFYNGQPVSGNAFIVRQDLMDKHGLKAPKTTDELYTLLKTIKDKEPNMIPLVGAGGNNGDPLAPLGSITSAFGLAVPYAVKDDKLVPTTNLYMKDALAYITKLYSEGLLDKEYLFNKTAQRDEKIASGKAFAFNGGVYNIKNLTESAAKNTPQVKFSILPEIQGPNGMKGQSQPNPVAQVNVIPKTAKYPLEAMDLLNLMVKDKELQNFINYGKEGVHYEKKSGALTPIQPAYDNILYKIHYRLWNDPEIWLPNALLAGYENDLKGYTASGPHMTVFNINTFKPRFEVEVSKSKTLNDLAFEYHAKIISGALPLTAFDDYIKKADAAGRQEIIKATDDWFEKEGKAVYQKLNKK